PVRPQHRPTLFPYTTLFRSKRVEVPSRGNRLVLDHFPDDIPGVVEQILGSCQALVSDSLQFDRLPIQDVHVNWNPTDFADVHQGVRPTVDVGNPRSHQHTGESFPKNRKNNLLYPRNSALYHVVSLCQSRRSRNDVEAGDVFTGWPVPVHYVVTEFDRESRPVDQGDKRVLAPGVYIDAGIA